MPGRKLQPHELPDWPRWLSAKLAAAYVGVSENTFSDEVKADIWPKPTPRGKSKFWCRHALDEASDKLAGNDLQSERAAMLRSISET